MGSVWGAAPTLTFLSRETQLKLSDSSKYSAKMVLVVEENDENSILEKCNVPAGQERARESNTNIEYVSNLNMYSTANKMRLSGIVCTIGPDVIVTGNSMLRPMPSGLFTKHTVLM